MSQAFGVICYMYMPVCIQCRQAKGQVHFPVRTIPAVTVEVVSSVESSDELRLRKLLNLTILCAPSFARLPKCVLSRAKHPTRLELLELWVELPIICYAFMHENGMGSKSMYDCLLSAPAHCFVTRLHCR